MPQGDLTNMINSIGNEWTCPICSTRVAFAEEYCPNCGQYRGEPDIPQIKAPFAEETVTLQAENKALQDISQTEKSSTPELATVQIAGVNEQSGLPESLTNLQIEREVIQQINDVEKEANAVSPSISESLMPGSVDIEPPNSFVITDQVIHHSLVDETNPPNPTPIQRPSSKTILKIVSGVLVLTVVFAACLFLGGWFLLKAGNPASLTSTAAAGVALITELDSEVLINTPTISPTPRISSTPMATPSPTRTFTITPTATPTANPAPRFYNWSTEVVDTSSPTGLFTALAVSKNGIIHIAYYQENFEDARYAVWQNGNWTYSAVQSKGRCGYLPSIALNSYGDPTITYTCIEPSSIQIAGRKNGIWTNPTIIIDVNTGSGSLLNETSSTILIDSNNISHLAYYNPDLTDVEYLSSESGWPLRLGDAHQEGIKIGLAQDSAGTLYACYSDGAIICEKLTPESNSWETLPKLSSSGSDDKFPAIAIDSDNQLHLLYYDAENGILRYAHWDGNIWHETELEHLILGRYIGLVIGPYDDLHACVYHKINGDSSTELLYLHQIDGNWLSFETIQSGDQIGRYCSIAVDNQDRPYISYQDGGKGYLMLARGGR